jgi:hypothetical protein
MTPEIEALARRAVACRGWRWMGGMRWIDNRPPPLEPIALRVADNRPRDGWDVPRHALPDLTDPATLGCLLALVREAWDDPYLIAAKERGAGWIIDENQCNSMLVGGRYIRGATEAEALIAALEVAP